jgi:hypothetical protein
VPGDDDVVGVLGDVDDSVEVTRGGVIEVALPLLVLLDYVVPTFGTLCIPELVMLLLSVVSIFYHDGVCNVETHCRVHTLIERIRDVVVIVFF